jgi:hypothetical protein
METGMLRALDSSVFQKILISFILNPHEKLFRPHKQLVPDMIVKRIKRIVHLFLVRKSKYA